MRNLAVAVATLGGVGRVPVAPGTVGSLCALPLARWVASVRDTSPLVAAMCVLGVAALAVWSAGRAAPALGAHDHGAVVIDEVAGMALGGAFVPSTWVAALVLFACFRVFDVWKPFPAGRIDRTVRGGLGVVGDDLVAGLYAGVVATTMMRFA